MMMNVDVDKMDDNELNDIDDNIDDNDIDDNIDDYDIDDDDDIQCQLVVDYLSHPSDRIVTWRTVYTPSFRFDY